ncbi:MAG: bis(5'-nucleosyl)-tetraphosphatase (symmetrical) YqeK [Lachnospiraceae bacterium]|nr:bis(5'-nucleosyl)-tetraphosphatase (symmetrical) YqeK [Lachnospiraceae bacterium]
MAISDYKAIKKILSKQLDPKRYEHTIGVAYTAAALAMRYHADVEKAYLAGLLHDCAKCIDTDEKLALCKKYKVKLSEFEIENPFLIHAKLGSCLAEKKYEVSDPDVLSAIRYHTTGKADMSLLEKIVFSADYIEPGRKMIPGLEEIRETIFVDLDRAVYMILEGTMRHLKNKDQPIDQASIDAYEFYKKYQEDTDDLI